jgi:hypothetical protein
VKKEIEYECIRATYEKLRGMEGVCLRQNESPDYLCQRRGKTLFGIEVTEIYHNEGAARIEKIKGYSTDLLSKKPYRHKDDRKYLKVVKARFPAEDDQKEIEVEGLLQELPPYPERVALLTKAIASKERKHKTYRQQAPAVDLILYDPTGLFSFKDFPRFFPAFAKAIGKVSVVNSEFREVFLLTKRISGGVLRVALKLNIVVAEIIAFEILIRRSRFARSRPEEWRNLLYLVSALNLAGFGCLKAFIDHGILCLAWGPWLLRYESGGKKIRDTTLLRRAPVRGELLDTAVPFDDFSPEERRFVRGLIKKRTRIATCVPLVFPADVERPEFIALGAVKRL